MLRYRESGQQVFFGMTTLAGSPRFSGDNLGGSLSGKISGYVSCDNGVIAGLAGYVTEQGYGQYAANLFENDTSGLCVGYCFVGPSGTATAFVNDTTTGNVSGKVSPASGVWPASGAHVSITRTQLSGASVSVASGTTYLGSGHQVAVFSGCLSGQQVTLVSGQSWSASGSP